MVGTSQSPVRDAAHGNALIKCAIAIGAEAIIVLVFLPAAGLPDVGAVIDPVLGVHGEIGQ